MDAAWDLGIRRFDTADAYGGGRSESWIGDWRKQSRKLVHVTTKTFNPMAEGEDAGLAPKRVRRQVVESARRLRTDAIDLYLAHEWDSRVPVAEVVGVFTDLVREGIVGAFGFSNISLPQLRSALALSEPKVVQNSYSLLLRVDEAELIPVCLRNRIAYEAYSPLAGGWLTGKYRANAPLPPASRMALAPQWYAHVDPATAPAKVEALTEKAAEFGISTPGMALAWVIHSPDVTSTIIGPKRRDHLGQTVEACTVELTSEDRAQLASFFGTG
jgi:aryl-alcohol dehydrogenase-like predicted oxidoreductase